MTPRRLVCTFYRGRGYEVTEEGESTHLDACEVVARFNAAIDALEAAQELLNDWDDRVDVLQKALEAAEARPCVEICQQERAKGNGGCGACALCCRELQAQLDALRVAFIPVVDWYDGDGRYTDFPAMLTQAVADLQEDRAENLRNRADAEVGRALGVLVAGRQKVVNVTKEADWRAALLATLPAAARPAEEQGGKK